MRLGLGRLSLVVLLAATTVSCQSEDKPPLPHYVSNYSDYGAPSGEVARTGEKRHFIEFRSRYALSYGHTYVIFGQVNKAGQMINPEVAGLAPATLDPTPYVIGHFVPVPAETGASDGDLEEQYRSASWRVMLTEEQYNSVVAYIRDLKARSHFWQASVQNCNAFVADIARHMGYKTPGIWLRPQQFVTKLREMNGG
ncbi:hypothetical protein MRS76_21030 [Rhizobiaceae bacterium n13]|uniref:Lipoprotein n=1 Tax=Ferirhizobium litorale TaxID=2927786 RepID=A0AAE3QIN6_9HYPH|nr:hypothetical protein [Fererhizobium litorale]MDI7864426.1 hypothetical protein [Fererhizobium litorale]MDI7924660.1 hypothetical protein [Fererhizobium litorale]